MVRFGVIGCGTHARWAVLKAIRQFAQNCELAAVADLRAENLEAVDDPNVGRYTDYREMLARDDLDAVFVVTRVDAHCEPTVAALESGRHVVCEKPMANNVEECRRMIDAAESAGRILVVDFEMHYYKQYRKIKEWISLGYLGEIQAIHAMAFGHAHKAFGELAARREKSLNQSGAMNCGVHNLDLMRYFCGGEWEDIEARGAWFHEDTKYPPHQSIMARLSTGVLVTLNSSSAYTAYVEPSASCGHLTIVGTKGVVHEGGGEVQLVSEAHTESVPCEHPGHKEAIGWLLDDFADVVEGRQPRSEMLPTGYDGLMSDVIVKEVNRLAVARRETTSDR